MAYAKLKKGTAAEWLAAVTGVRVIPEGAWAQVVDDEGKTLYTVCGDGTTDIFELEKFHPSPKVSAILPSSIPLTTDKDYIINSGGDLSITFDQTANTVGRVVGVITVYPCDSISSTPSVSGDALDNTKINSIKYMAVNGTITDLLNAVPSTPDVVVPTLSSVSISDITETTSTFNATPSEVVDIVWAVYTSSSTRNAASFAAVEAGTGSVDFGIIADAASGANATDNVTGLTADTACFVRAYARDESSNESIAYDVDFTSVINTSENVGMGLNTGTNSAGDGVFINSATQFNSYFVGDKKLVGSGEISALAVDTATNESSIIALDETPDLENTTGLQHKIYIDSGQRVAWVIDGGSVNKTTNPVPDNTILSLLWDGTTITWRYTTNNGVNWNNVATFSYSGAELYVKGTPIQVGLQITDFRISSATATLVE